MTLPIDKAGTVVPVTCPGVVDSASAGGASREGADIGDPAAGRVRECAEVRFRWPRRRQVSTADGFVAKFREEVLWLAPVA